MTNADTAGVPPFAPIIAAAVHDAKARRVEIAEAQAAAPDQWQALRLRRYWNGDSTVVLLKPEDVHPTELYVSAGNAPQEFRGGDGIVAVLVRGSTTTLTATFEVPGARIDQTMTIRDL